ncbi:cupin domain-containing protein [Pseudomonas fulva]|nr:cupin domain-containing protein [Pseudomonas fulva]MBF8778115.1 cupin domain-containing protein [Pseudomonas fulva]
MNIRHSVPATLLAYLLLQGTAFAASATKKELVDTPYPAGYHTHIVETRIPANAQAPLHSHPGIESGYILSGGGMLHIEGQSAREMKPGSTALVPPNTRHWFKNGPQETVIVSTYVLEDGKEAMQLVKP